MAQQDVMDFLKKNLNKEYTSRQIYENIDISLGSIHANLKKLKKFGIVKARPTENRRIHVYWMEKEHE